MASNDFSRVCATVQVCDRRGYHQPGNNGPDLPTPLARNRWSRTCPRRNFKFFLSPSRAATWKPWSGYSATSRTAGQSDQFFLGNIAMPIHDWPGVPPGLFHDFHRSRSIRIKGGSRSSRKTSRFPRSKGFLIVGQGLRRRDRSRFAPWTVRATILRPKDRSESLLGSEDLCLADPNGVTSVSTMNACGPDRCKLRIDDVCKC